MTFTLEPRYATERRRALVTRRRAIEDELAEQERYRLSAYQTEADEARVAGLEAELELVTAALEPFTLSEAMEDLRLACRRLVRTILEALR